jgi:hypothetical protein
VGGTAGGEAGANGEIGEYIQPMVCKQSFMEHFLVPDFSIAFSVGWILADSLAHIRMLLESCSTGVMCVVTCANPLFLLLLYTFGGPQEEQDL